MVEAVPAVVRDCLIAFILVWTNFFIFHLVLRIIYMFSLTIGFSCIHRITTNVVGISIIILSNYLASACFVSMCNYCELESIRHTVTTATCWDMLLCTSLVILLIFIHSGGVPSQLFPSHVTCPGAFAREYVKVDNKGLTPNPTMKQKVQKIGARRGCHHCGKFSNQYISDHMPPTVLYHDKEFPQRLYPQCRECSLFQGGTLSTASSFPYFSRRGVISYPWRFQKWLIWFPYYLLIEYLFDASGNLQKAKAAEYNGVWSIISAWRY